MCYWAETPETPQEWSGQSSNHFSPRSGNDLLSCLPSNWNGLKMIRSLDFLENWFPPKLLSYKKMISWLPPSLVTKSVWSLWSKEYQKVGSSLGLKHRCSYHSLSRIRSLCTSWFKVMPSANFLLTPLWKGRGISVPLWLSILLLPSHLQLWFKDLEESVLIVLPRGLTKWNFFIQVNSRGATWPAMTALFF